MRILIFIFLQVTVISCDSSYTANDSEMNSSINSYSCSAYTEDTTDIVDNTTNQNTVINKVNNRPTIPVFYPWSGTGSGIYGTCGASDNVWFDCDNDTTPYSLLWTSKGRVNDVESLSITINDDQKELISSIKMIETFKGNLNDSDISFITKA